MFKKSIVIIGVFLLITAVSGFFWTQKHGWPTFKAQTGMLKDIDEHLNKDQQKIYTDKIKQAEDYLKTIPANNPGAPEERGNTYIFLAQQYFGLGQMQKSKDMYLLALQNFPSSDNAVMGLAATDIAAGDKAGAQTVLEQVINKGTKNPDLWLQYIKLRQGTNAANEEIINLYGRALLNTNRYIDVLTSDATFEESTGQNAEAVKLWQEAAKSNPANAAAYETEINRLQGK